MSVALARVQQLITAHAEAWARPPDDDAGDLVGAPHAELLEAIDDGDITAWFCGDFVIRYGGQAGSDWYLHVIEVGRVVVTRAGDPVEAVVERRETAHVTEAAWQLPAPGPSYDRRQARERLIAAWWPPISAMP